MPRRGREAKVAFARIEFAEGSFLPAEFGPALEEDLQPGKSVVRYGRLWRMTRHREQERWIFGRLGFEYPGAGEVGLWEETLKDYRSIQPAQIVRYASVHKPARIYDMRHTFASNALAAGIAVFELAQVMGTSVLMIERVYGTLLDGAVESIGGRLSAWEHRQRADAEHAI